MPSGSSIDVSLPYTAPAHGWITAIFTRAAGTGWTILDSGNLSSGQDFNNSIASRIWTTLPIAKGQRASARLQNASFTSAKFIYAEGAAP